MKFVLTTRRALAGVVASAALLGGCAAPAKSIYGWGSYQQQVYDHFRGDGRSPQDQLASLQQDLQTIQSKGEAVPPGYHAHLGLLYGELGQPDQMRQQLLAEKELFPESATFMDFLLKKMPAKQGEVR
ncbi:DUF4810 domain-containing protein [Chitinimonas sp.]|uniref:DUF4810 domain-containing protein n=1 Tax=Chitinimonas sp. TaxID=1934313 RepID=UPI002F92550A